MLGTPVFGEFLPFFSADPLKLCQVWMGSVTAQVPLVVLLEGSPNSTEELWSSVRVTIRFLITSLPKALLRLLSVAGQPALGRVLVVPNFFHLRMMEATVLGDLQCIRHFLVPFPDLCLDTILRTIPPTSWIGFCSDMHSQLWDLI